MDDWGPKPWKTFSEKAIALRKQLGADSHPIITKEKHPQQWRDWYAYYGFRKMEASQDLMREKTEKTVPTLSPFDFDASFSLRDPAPEVPKNLPPSKNTPRFMIEAEKARARNANRPVLFRDVSYDQFRIMSKNREIPVGAIWCGALGGTVFGLKPKAVSAAAE